MSAKIGRPTECKKEHDVKVRIDNLTHEKLLNYSKISNVRTTSMNLETISLIVLSSNM